MDDTSIILKNILADMSGHLSVQELGILEDSLVKNLKDVSISRNTELEQYTNLDINDRLLKMYVASKRLEGMSEKTIFHYVYETRKFLQTINKTFANVSTVDVQYYLSNYERTRKVSRSTLDNMRRSINGIFIWLYDNKYISENPLSPIKKFNYEQKAIETLSDEEIFRIREYTHHDLRTRAIIELLLATGIRVSELCSVNIEDVDFEKSEIVIHCAKKRRKQDRLLFLSVEAKNCIWEYLQYRKHFISPDNTALFIANRNGGHRCGERVVNTSLSTVAKKCNLNKKVTVHTFRKTLASRLYSKGARPRDIAYILGHADSRMSETYYIKLEVEDVRRNYYKCI